MQKTSGAVPRLSFVVRLPFLNNVALGAALWLSAAAARAQDLAAPATNAPAAGTPAPAARLGGVVPGPEYPASAAGDQKEKGKQDKAARKAEAEGIPQKDALEFHGRVFAEGSWERETTDTGAADSTTDGLRFSVPSARAGFKARPHDKLTLALEVDFAPKPALKDAFVQTKHKHWAVRAGQFKMPISSLTLESPWTLPIARRGIIHDFLANDLQLFGRRPGLQGVLRGGGSMDPTFTLGLFRAENSQTNSMGGAPLPDAKPLDLTVVSRFAISPLGQEVAAVGQLRTTDVNQTVGRHHFWAAGVDTTIDVPLSTNGIRAWAEAYMGSSWIDHTIDARGATFLESRALVAYRFGGLDTGETYVEPFALASFLDPDLNTVGDVFLEGMGGIAVGFWRQARLTLQVEYAKSARNFPVSYWVATPPLNHHLAVILEAGAAF